MSDLIEIKQEMSQINRVVMDLDNSISRLQKTIGSEYFEGELSKFYAQAKIIADRLSETGLLELRIKKLENRLDAIELINKKSQ